MVRSLLLMTLHACDVCELLISNHTNSPEREASTLPSVDYLVLMPLACLHLVHLPPQSEN